ncbi:glycosyltransferase family 39 protein [Candidatus Calescamantes bacterium]|nr:glycosyltransferase family 39 protein [Candidatus Calescamantes bacterium]
MNKKETINFVLVLSLSFVLGIIGINWGLPSETLHLQTYHPDEVWVLVSFQKMNPKRLDFNPHFFPWGTFHFYVVGAFLYFLSLFKAVTLEPSKEFYILHLTEIDKLYVAGRLVSVFATVGTVFFLFRIAEKLYSRRTAIFSALIMSILPLSVANAHYMKPNALGVFLIVLTCWVSLRILSLQSFPTYALAGFVAGLACATKYNGIWAVFFPLMFHFLLPYKERKNIFLIYTFLFFFLGFFTGCPYSLLAFKEFKEGIFYELDKFILVQHGDIGNPFFYHLFFSLRYGMGTPLFLLSIFSWCWSLVRKEKKSRFFSLWVFSYYLFICVFFKSKFARYMLPLLPFLSLLSGEFLTRIPFRKWRYFPLLVILFFFYNFLYVLSYDKLFLSPDPRTEASRWIEENIPVKSSIGVIFEPYFFTPPIIYMEYWVEGESAYNRGQPEKFNQYSILVWRKEKWRKEKPEYLVISEYEIRDFLRFPYLFPQEKELIEEIQRDYILIKKFDTPLTLGKMRFRKGFPPHDLLYPFPYVEIFKLKK